VARMRKGSGRGLGHNMAAGIEKAFERVFVAPCPADLVNM